MKDFGCRTARMIGYICIYIYTHTHICICVRWFFWLFQATFLNALGKVAMCTTIKKMVLVFGTHSQVKQFKWHFQRHVLTFPSHVSKCIWKSGYVHNIKKSTHSQVKRFKWRFQRLLRFKKRSDSICECVRIWYIYIYTYIYICLGWVACRPVRNSTSTLICLGWIAFLPGPATFDCQ